MIETISFHIAEVYTQCPAQYYHKFLHPEDHPMHAFTEMSTMLAGRLLMFAIDHEPLEVEREMLRLTDRTSLSWRGRERLRKILVRGENIRREMYRWTALGWSFAVSRSSSKRYTTPDGRTIDSRAEADLIAYRQDTDQMVIFEIKATANRKYNVDLNLQLEWLRRFTEYDDGEHPHHHVDRLQWLFLEDWSNPSDEVTSIEDPADKSGFFDRFLVPKLKELLTKEDDARRYPPKPQANRCGSCFYSSQCHASDTEF